MIGRPGRRGGFSLPRAVIALLLIPSGAGAYAQDAAAPELRADPPLNLRMRDCPPPASADDIVVCGRRDDERYRLPRDRGFDWEGAVDSVSRERHRLMELGDSGIGSCSTVGAGGWTGCFERMVKHRQQQRAGR